MGMASKVLVFCQMTSMKGIPRLLRAKSVFMRFVWAINIIGFLSIAAYQTVLLTKEYFQYKVYTSTGEIIMPYFDQTQENVGTPDVTLCNANPFASNKSGEFPTMEEYFRLVKQATSCDDNCTDEECVALNHIRKAMLSTRGYFSYIGGHNAKKIGHSLESFLAYCDLHMDDGVYIHHTPCTSAAQIIKIQHGMLFNCYTIRLPLNEFPDKIFKGFIAVLHLDDYDAFWDEQTLLTPHEEPGQMSGAWVFVHQRNTPLHVYYNRFMLQPGNFHDIPVKMELRMYLPTPHGRCQNANGEKYSLHQCFANCLQTRIYEQCGCLDQQNYTSQWEPLDTNWPQCLSLSLEKTVIVRNWRCAMKEKMKGALECRSSCPERCQVIRYHLKVPQYLHLSSIFVFYFTSCCQIHMLHLRSLKYVFGACHCFANSYKPVQLMCIFLRGFFLQRMSLPCFYDCELWFND